MMLMTCFTARHYTNLLSPILRLHYLTSLKQMLAPISNHGISVATVTEI